MARIPDHPGAHHYVIHAYDSPPLAESALPAARRTERSRARTTTRSI